MGCIPACFGRLRRNATMKRVQHQCLSPSDEQHEPAKSSLDKIESHKEGEGEGEEEEENKKEIDYLTKLISQPEDEMDNSNKEKTVFDDSNAKRSSDEVGSNNDEKVEKNENGKAEEERENGKEEESMNDKKCANSVECYGVEEESAGSLFSLSIDSRKHFEMGDKEVNSPFKMNNTSHECHGEKEKAHLSKDAVIEQSKPLSDGECKRRGGEMAVETSLSGWLGCSGSPESEKNYVHEDRLIDSPAVVKGFASAGSTPSPSPSPSCSADDQPGIGTVARYWRQTSSQPQCKLLLA